MVYRYEEIKFYYLEINFENKIYFRKIMMKNMRDKYTKFKNFFFKIKRKEERRRKERKREERRMWGKGEGENEGR